jgi:di/tricarboxylate transporter
LEKLEKRPQKVFELAGVSNTEIILAFAAPAEWKMGIVLSLLVVAIVLFALESISVDVITMTLLLVLMGTQILSPAAAFAGFSEDIIVMLASVFVIGGMTAFGTAIEQTGTARLLAQMIDTSLAPLGVTGVLAGYFVLTILLTQPMSNAAAALVVLPIALESARLLGANERTFAIAIMFAGSISFIAPFEPSCILARLSQLEGMKSCKCLKTRSWSKKVCTKVSFR